MEPRKIQITAGKVSVRADLNDSITAAKVWEALPIRGKVNRWGEEIYFKIPVEMEAENPKSIVEVGELGYWPDGEAFCIFFGPTPISEAGKIRPASPVNPIGKVSVDPEVLKEVAQGEVITLEKVKEGRL